MRFPLRSVASDADRQRGRTSARRVERLIGTLGYLTVAAIVGVAAMGALSTHQLDRTAARSGNVELAVEELNAALVNRSKIDTDLLQVAISQPLDGSPLDRAVAARQHLVSADQLLVDADADPALLSEFRAMATSLNAFMTTATEVIREIAVDPAAAPAHLITLHDASVAFDRTLQTVSTTLQATNESARRTTDASVEAANIRALLVMLVSVGGLTAIAIVIGRRVRAAFAEKAAAEAAIGAATNQLKEQVVRQEFAGDLREALENAEDESDALAVAELAMAQSGYQGSTELLLADSSRAHLRRAATTSAAPGCGVGSPWECPAVRRGRTLTFESSAALRACPHLRNREGAELSAVCTPLLFSGRGIGVIHAFAPGSPPDTTLATAQLATVASEVATRIGTIRVLTKNQFQAKTDGLTGMLNRRRLEEILRDLTDVAEPFSVAMVDLDHFKLLNDTYGHEAGDRALRVFSRVATDVLRAGDTAGRYGGEEFVLAFPGLGGAATTAVIERLRSALRFATEGGACPDFTASFGIAEWSPGVTVDELLRVADTRLLAAKVAGRDRIVFELDDEPSASGTGNDIRQPEAPSRPASLVGGIDRKAS